ncbi:winged helix-turn-helix domain-containing protein [Nonomuraea sp. NPDC050328]|uniref:winged helix-turn-helix domain-containing protein n=1 Tax=Nonomuraea sp. NPDC050328 TaxID=3364361 RepID=UPI0037AF8D51
MQEFEFRENEHRWVQVYELIKTRIEDATYRPHMMVPSERTLEQELGVSAKTTRKAIRRLREEGLVYTKPNLGTFVADRDEVADRATG